MRLADVKGFVLDVDGTLVHRSGRDLSSSLGRVEFLERIRATGRPFVLFTNGSHVAPETFAAESAPGLPLGDDELLTPLVSVQFCLRRGAPAARVLLFGGEEPHELPAAGGCPARRGAAPDVVFVAHSDRSTSTPRARRPGGARGARAAHCQLPACYAGANGPILSRGAMTAAAIAKASSARPLSSASRRARRCSRSRTGSEPRLDELAFIGDDVNMDIALGRMGGSRTVLVRSGISGPIELDSSRSAAARTRSWTASSTSWTGSRRDSGRRSSRPATSRRPRRSSRSGAARAGAELERVVAVGTVQHRGHPPGEVLGAPDAAQAALE